MKKKFRIISVMLLLCVIGIVGMSQVSLVNNNYLGMDDKLQEAFVDKLRSNDSYYWSRDDASKWISSYKILDIDKTNYKTYDVNVEFLWNNRFGEQETSNDVLTINLK